MLKSKVDFDKDLRNIQARLKDSGKTALYDAIIRDIKALRRADPYFRRQLGYARVVCMHLVITDGINNHGESTADDVLEMLRNPNVQGYHLFLIGANLSSEYRTRLKTLCDSYPKWSTFIGVDGVGTQEFHLKINNLRTAIRILLKIQEGTTLSQTIDAEVDRGNFEEVLRELT